MRLPFLLSAVLFLLGISGPVSAQSVRIDSVRIGFRPNSDEDFPSALKIGFWTPLQVSLLSQVLDEPVKGLSLDVETIDSEDVANVISKPIPPLNANNPQGVLMYVRPGTFSANVTVKLRQGERILDSKQINLTRPVLFDSQLFVSLGAKLPDLEPAFKALVPFNESGEEFHQARLAGYETEVKNLPDQWLGYHGVDLLLVCTADAKFVEDFANDPERIKALSQWVRGGGRLVVGVARQNQGLVGKWLGSPFWQPPVPLVPPADAGRPGDYTLRRLLHTEDWGRIPSKPFPNEGEDPIPIAKLLLSGVPANEPWEILADEAGRDDTVRKPTFIRMPYGRGQITLIAFSPDEPVFKLWEGRADLLKTMILRLAPRASPERKAGSIGQTQDAPKDLAGDLERMLDRFDVPVIPFGYVALLMFLYILVFGPLDYLFLRYVVRRMEWTWFSFPLVIVAVSAAAFYSAASLKGNELKINRVDIVDVDQRTDLDAKGQARQAIVSGQTFFCLFSPNIASYGLTVGRAEGFWNKGPAEEVLHKSMSWLGRPDFDAFCMGRTGSQTFTRKPYKSTPDSDSLEDLPLSIWSSKALSARWDAPLPAPALWSDLVYYQKPIAGRDIKIGGSLRSNLAVDLDDAWVFYGERCYPLLGGLKKGVPLLLQIEGGNAVDVPSWAKHDLTAKTTAEQNPYHPTPLVKQILFYERIDVAARVPNYSLRHLDMSWLVKRETSLQTRDTNLRDVIVFGRVNAQDEGMAPVALRLTGTEDQAHVRRDTYVRIHLAARPAEE